MSPKGLPVKPRTWEEAYKSLSPFLVLVIFLRGIVWAQSLSAKFPGVALFVADFCLVTVGFYAGFAALLCHHFGYGNLDMALSVSLSISFMMVGTLSVDVLLLGGLLMVTLVGTCTTLAYTASFLIPALLGCSAHVLFMYGIAKIVYDARASIITNLPSQIKSLKQFWALLLYGVYITATCLFVLSKDILFPLTPYTKWALMGIVGSGAYGIISYSQLAFTQTGERIRADLGKWASRIVTLVMAALIVLTILSYFFMVGYSPQVRGLPPIDRDIFFYFSCLLVCAILVAIVDFGIYRKIGGVPQEKLRFKKLLLYFDIPVLSGFASLFVWVIIDGLSLYHSCASQFESFVYGTVAFQLISSNLVFAFIQSKFD